MYLESFKANFSEKIFRKSAYLLKTLIKALSAFRLAIYTLFKRSILSSKSMLKIAMYTIKTLYSESKTIATNLFFFISSTCLVVKNTSLVM